MTLSARIAVDLASWIPGTMMVVGLGLLTILVVELVANPEATDPNAFSASINVALIGLIALVAGLVGRLVIAPLMVPHGSVEAGAGGGDRVVELRNVHPAFANPVLRQQHERADQGADDVQHPLASQAEPPAGQGLPTS